MSMNGPFDLTPEGIASAQGEPVPRWRRALWRVEYWWHQIARKLPRLVWPGDEVDIRITFKENPLRAGTMDHAYQDLHRGTFYKCQELLNEVGITFDTGMGPNGRDWEWDYSLSGPVAVKFVGRSKRPERRK